MTVTSNTRKLKFRIAIAILVVGILPILIHYIYPADVSAVSLTDTDLPYRESPLLEQYALCFTGFVVKPVYMLLSLVIAFFLWRSTATDLIALRWGLLFFFGGEAACAVNYWIFQHESPLSEYLHNYGMVLAFAFVGFAFFEGLDARIVRFSVPDRKCAFLGLCRACYKQDPDFPCFLKRMFLFLIPLMFVLSFMPLCESVYLVSYNTHIFGTPYRYFHATVDRLYEIRFCPLLAMLCFATSFFTLLSKRVDAVLRAKLWFSAGLGAWGFSVFRFLLFGAYRENLVWFNAWEEITELFLMLAIGLVLWLYRKPLLQSR